MKLFGYAIGFAVLFFLCIFARPEPLAAQKGQLTIKGSITDINGELAKDGVRVVATVTSNGEKVDEASTEVGDGGAYELTMQRGDAVELSYIGRNGRKSISDLSGKVDRQDIHVRLKPFGREEFGVGFLYDRIHHAKLEIMLARYDPVETRAIFSKLTKQVEQAEKVAGGNLADWVKIEVDAVKKISEVAKESKKPLIEYGFNERMLQKFEGRGVKPEIP